ncbi:cyclin [Trypanosoma grayi]|uniref:cyclin n=1 Tax=Trypanosoma grayi TaxID=71804 RepID=UPI0004F47FCE|nr:cyclin [Trypanosoma grayi]KEG15463.1 cyclin [Trypanosoma grayi]
MADIITVYVQHLMKVQSEMREEPTELEVASPTESFPSFKIFSGDFVPNISLEKYTHRLVTYIQCSPEAYIFALAYIRRLFFRRFPLHSGNIHRVLLTAVVIAAKTRDDLYFSMSYYAHAGGVSNRYLNMMELRFLADLIDFRAEVSPTEYRLVCNSIITAKSFQRVSSNMSDLCDVTASNTPSELEDTPLAGKPQWITECQLHW